MSANLYRKIYKTYGYFKNRLKLSVNSDFICRQDVFYSQQKVI